VRPRALPATVLGRHPLASFHAGDALALINAGIVTLTGRPS